MVFFKKAKYVWYVARWRRTAVWATVSMFASSIPQHSSRIAAHKVSGFVWVLPVTEKGLMIKLWKHETSFVV